MKREVIKGKGTHQTPTQKTEPAPRWVHLSRHVKEVIADFEVISLERL